MVKHGGPKDSNNNGDLDTALERDVDSDGALDNHPSAINVSNSCE